MGKTKMVLLIMSSLLGCVSIVFALYILSKDLNHINNTFVRLFPPHPIGGSTSLDIKYNSYYIAGSTGKTIYLGNSTAPAHLLITNASLSDTTHVVLKIPTELKAKLKSFKVSVDSPFFYIHDGISPAILQGRVGIWKADKFMYDSAYFTQSVAIGKKSFIIRSVSNRTGEYVLAKETNELPHLKLATNILEKQVDGLFCTDGTMHYVSDLGALVYVYFYRNQFIRIDTNLNVVFRGKTIDTVSRAKIQVAKISSENAITLSAPPLLVNKRSTASGNWLFVNSNLLAKNELKTRSEKAAVVDVYDLSNGIYQFSFYLYNYGDEKLTDILVRKDLLIALHGKYILTYKLVPRYFQK